MDRSTTFSILILTNPVYGVTATHPDKETARDLVARLLADRGTSHPDEARVLQLASDSWPLKPEVNGFTVIVETPA